MRKFLINLTLLTCFITGALFQGRAQVNGQTLRVDTQSEAAVDELLELTGAKKNMQTMLDAMVITYKKQIPSLPPAYLDALQKAFNYDSLLTQIIPIYTRHLSLSDIKGLIVFYKTPLGQKLIQETPKILQECMELGAKWGAEAGKKVLEDYKDGPTENAGQDAPPVLENQ